MYLHVSVCPPGGGWSPDPHPGERLRGLAWGGPQAHAWGGYPGPHPGGYPGPGLGGGCIPACTEVDTTPPSRQLLLRVVRILLECILVGCSNRRSMDSTNTLHGQWYYMWMVKRKLIAVSILCRCFFHYHRTIRSFPSFWNLINSPNR